MRVRYHQITEETADSSVLQCLLPLRLIFVVVVPKTATLVVFRDGWIQAFASLEPLAAVTEP